MLQGKKTYIVALAGVVLAVAGYFHGDLSLAQSGQAALTAVLGMTIRNAI